MPLPPVHPDTIGGDLAQPGAEGAFPSPVESRDLANKDQEDLLGHVIDLVTQARHPPDPATDQGAYKASNRFQSGSSDRATLRRSSRLTEVGVTVGYLKDTRSEPGRPVR